MRPIKFRTASPCELWSWCELIRFQTSHSRSRLKLTADPRECRAGNDLRPKDVRVPLSYQDRSPVRPIALQIAQEFVDRHNRLAFRWPLPDRNWRRHPALPEGV